MSFDPFENRLARDIRNTIGPALIQSIKERTAHPFSLAVQSLSSRPLTADMENYINHRKKCLDAILDQLKTDTQALEFSQILIRLWDENLYFEVHEWLEQEWITRTGDEKKGFQALIQAAVALEHFEYNRLGSAKKLAQKARKKLEALSDSIPEPFNSQMFIIALNRILAC